MTTSEHTSFSLQGASTGRLGLGLSGGGFRASLFHIGVLAQLADLDLLRYVATISTVSGGSIIGAYYQLKVKQLLEGRRADQLTPSTAAFRQLVKEVEHDFVVAIQHNLRISTFTDRAKNTRMLGDTYTSTQRVADLFDKHFFYPISGQANTYLSDLLINPIFDPMEPGHDNAFVTPQLILNSTSLNTGHLFQFTGRYIGEGPVNSVLGGISPMANLQRLYLDDDNLNSRQRARLARITLGDAVVASCCVPGLLNPYTLSGLYQDNAGNDVTVRLVDGGVFDNQGVVSLFEDGCTHFICSDATDLLAWDSTPSDRMHNVLVRTNDIMMDRVRGELMEELVGLGGDRYAIFTLGDLDGPRVFSEEAARVVSALAHIRTDLDAFSDTEASALMYYGFGLSGHTLKPASANNDAAKPEVDTSDDDTSVAKATTPAPEADAAKPATAADTALTTPWAFNAVQDVLADTASREHLLKQLELGARQFMKVFYMGKPLPYVIVIVPLLIPIALIGLLISVLPPVPTSAWVVLGLIMLTALAYSQNARIVRWFDQFGPFRRFRLRLAMALKPLGITVLLGLIIAIFSQFYLKVFNRLFLRYGRIQPVHRTFSRKHKSRGDHEAQDKVASKV